jgi:hypothetical protein
VFNLRSILNRTLGYKIALWPKDSSWGFRIGLFLAGTHLCLFVSNTLDMIWHHEGRWHLYWILCGYIDFPVSLLLTKVILPVFFRGGSFKDPFMSMRISTLMVFAMFYSFVGTLWYFWLPLIMEKVGRKIAATGWTLGAVVLLIFLPILAHWLQLLRFATGNSKIFAPGLYGILSVVWTVLLIWLYLATRWRRAPAAVVRQQDAGARLGGSDASAAVGATSTLRSGNGEAAAAKDGSPRRVLWLLLLSPFVYYYFVRDLYYYLTLVRR